VLKLQKIIYKKNKKEGFSLVEMMLVIGIIGVLSTIIIGGLSALKSRARDSRRVHDFEQFRLSLDMFYGEYGNYPCGDSFSLALGTHWDSSFSCPFLDGNAGSASDPNYNGCIPAHGNNAQCTSSPTFGLYSSPERFYPLFDFRPSAQPDLYVPSSPGGYVYSVSQDRQKFLIQTRLETNMEAMMNDGGLCNNRYEVGTGLGVESLTNSSNSSIIFFSIPCN